METDYRQWLRKKYVVPFRTRFILTAIVFFAAAFICFQIPSEHRTGYRRIGYTFNTTGEVTFTKEQFITANIITLFLLLMLSIVFIVKAKAYPFYKDYKSARIVREQVQVIQSIPMSNGDTMYLLNSPYIASFHSAHKPALVAGHTLYIHYLEHSRQLLASET